MFGASNCRNGDQKITPIHTLACKPCIDFFHSRAADARDFFIPAPDRMRLRLFGLARPGGLEFRRKASFRL